MTTISSVPVNPDNVYYDLVITNIKSESFPLVPIYFNENRTNPIVNNSGDCELSIVRFSVDTQTLPVFIPTIQSNQNDADLTIYSVTISYQPVGVATPFVIQTYVRWSPQTINSSFSKSNGNWVTK